MIIWARIVCNCCRHINSTLQHTLFNSIDHTQFSISRVVTAIPSSCYIRDQSTDQNNWDRSIVSTRMWHPHSLGVTSVWQHSALWEFDNTSLIKQLITHPWFKLCFGRSRLFDTVRHNNLEWHLSSWTSHNMGHSVGRNMGHSAGLNEWWTQSERRTVGTQHKLLDMSSLIRTLLL